MTSEWVGGLEPWGIAALAVVMVAGGVALTRLVVRADADRRAQLRDGCAALVQYVLLFGFAAVAAAISAHGLIGFARASMGLHGAWPFLLWAALDGAAGMCAVLLMRRAARGESALAPRLAVWGLVAASSAFNWTHAPRHPGAREAFALMPLIAATLFEFSLRETRHSAQRSDRQVAGLRWLHPVERIRVQVELAADQILTGQAALRRVRVRRAAWCLHRLRRCLAAHSDEPDNPISSRATRRAEHRAQVALTLVGFTDPVVADEVLRLARVLSQTTTLAGLDHATSVSATAALTDLAIHAPCPAGTSHERFARRSPMPSTAIAVNGHSFGSGQRHADRLLVETACDVIAQARQRGIRLSQAALARELRAQGLSIANERLHWLAAVSGLDHDHGSQ